MNRLRIGIDVGGTNTDAVVVDESGRILASCKSPTTPNVQEGMERVLDDVTRGIDSAKIVRIMLGTSQTLNAVIRRQDLAQVGILRIGAPAAMAISPLAGWPADLVAAVRGPVDIIRGGHEYDGSEINPLDEAAVRDFAMSCQGMVEAIAVTAVASPVMPAHEERAAAIIREILGPDLPVTIGSDVAGTGIIERENTAVLNASLSFIARQIVAGLAGAMARRELSAEIFLTQNDGTLLVADEALQRPILTVGSGPTNSMRGAAYLSGLANAVVMDVGGTSTDVGLLVDGFPRTSAHNVEVGGVRTNFRMPDLISVGIGGGTLVRSEPLVIGPDSVGYRLTRQSLVFGGDTLTLSDLSVASSRAKFGTNPEAAEGIPAALVSAGMHWVDERLRVLSDRIKSSRGELPLIAVGGGAHLVPDSIPGISKVIRPEYAGVANALGAAVAEASGSVDRNFAYSASSRDACLDEAKATAIERAIRAGADPQLVRITTVNELPMSYMPGDCARVIVKAVGPILDYRVRS